MNSADEKAKVAGIAKSLRTAADLGPSALQMMIEWHAEHDGKDLTMKAAVEQIRVNAADIQREAHDEPQHERSRDNGDEF